MVGVVFKYTSFENISELLIKFYWFGILIEFMNVLLLIWLLVGTGIVRGLKFNEYESEVYYKSYVLIII